MVESSENNCALKEQVDYINHPPHYQTSSGLETIDVIEAFTEDLKGFEATNTGNVLKYMCRWKSKNGLEDLKKARWYLDRLIDHVEKQHEKEIQRVMHLMTSASAADNDYKGVVTARN